MSKSKKYNANICLTSHFFEALNNPFVSVNLDKLLVVIDSLGHIIYTNTAFQSVSGYRKNQLENQNFYLLFPRTGEAGDKKDNTPINFSSVADDFEISLYDQAGKLLCVEWSTTLLADKDGAIEYLVGIGNDCTTQQKALNHLEMSRKRFRDLVEVAGNWVWEVNAEYRFIYSSPQVEAILGYRPDEIIGKTPFDLMSEGEAERLRVYFRQRDKTAPIHHLQNTKLHKDGGSVVVETTGVPCFADNGVLSGYRGVARDVTARENTLSALKQSQRRLYLSQKFARIANWEYDIASGDIQCSDHIWPLFGLPENHFDLTREDFLKYVHPDDLAFLKQAFEHTIVDGDNYSVEYRVVWPDKSVHWLKGEGDLVRSDDGKLIRLLGITSNIDKHKDDELALMQRAEAQQAHAKAQQAHAKAQRNVLIREVHHRIKNNLQGIVGLLRNNLTNSAKSPEDSITDAITQIGAIALIHGIHGQRNGTELLLCELLPAIIKSQILSAPDCVGIDFVDGVKTSLQLIDQEAVPVALIFNELITNAIKHANKQQHKDVRVSLCVKNSQAKISVFCPGGCLPEKFDFQTGEGCDTGLGLVRALLPSKGIAIQYHQTLTGVLTDVLLDSPVLLRIVDKKD